MSEKSDFQSIMDDIFKKENLTEMFIAKLYDPFNISVESGSEMFFSDASEYTIDSEVYIHYIELIYHDKFTNAWLEKYGIVFRKNDIRTLIQDALCSENGISGVEARVHLDYTISKDSKVIFKDLSAVYELNELRHLDYMNSKCYGLLERLESSCKLTRLSGKGDEYYNSLCRTYLDISNENPIFVSEGSLKPDWLIENRGEYF